jgi:hypothetical protein
VPHADYFEGLMSHKAGGGGDVIPLFELVYGDCINLYTHQGDRANPDRPEYILTHLLYGEMPVYQFGSHLYWQQESSALKLRPSVASVRRTGPRTFEITYRWHVGQDLKQRYSTFVHFTSPRAQQPERIAFQNDHNFAIPTDTWRAGTVIEDGPYTVELPEGWRGECDITVGVLLGAARQPLAGLSGASGRYAIGRLAVSDADVRLLPAALGPPVDRRCFARADNGWAERLGDTDRFIKNTYEVLSALNRVTAHLPMTQHEFVDAARHVEHTVFGGDVHVYANYGPEPVEVAQCELPPFGFLVQSPTLVAFYATSCGGTEYPGGAMFVAQSLDGQPIAASQRLRIYHAFGDDTIRLAGKTHHVRTEAVVAP